jgi:hypothetical protein
MKQLLGVGSLMLAGLTTIAGEVANTATNVADICRLGATNVLQVAVETTKFPFTLSAGVVPLYEQQTIVNKPSTDFYAQLTPPKYQQYFTLSTPTQSQAIAKMLGDLGLGLPARLVSDRAGSVVRSQYADPNPYDSAQRFDTDWIRLAQEGLQISLDRNGLFRHGTLTADHNAAKIRFSDTWGKYSVGFDAKIKYDGDANLLLVVSRGF